MARIGGNLFEGVQFPIAFGDRYVTVSVDEQRGSLLVDVYRWDRTRNVLVAEMLQGRPLPGAPPLTLDAAGGAGAVRLGVSVDSPDLVGYLSGGDDPHSIVIRRDAIQVLRGDQSVLELSGVGIHGFPIGIQFDRDGGWVLGGVIPPDFPKRRLFLNADVVLTDLVGQPPVIQGTNFDGCHLIGPSIVAPLRAVHFKDSVFFGECVWELPAEEGIISGAIAAVECDFSRCQFDGVGIAVKRGQRDKVVAGLRRA